MDDHGKLQQILILLTDRDRCLCGFCESCEMCNPYSRFNKLRARVLEIIEGSKPPPDYRLSVVVSLEAPDA